MSTENERRAPRPKARLLPALLVGAIGGGLAGTACGGVVGVAGAWGLLTFGGVDVVRARQFNVEDRYGTLRASLGVEGSNVGLVLADASEMVRATLALEGNGSVILGLFNAAEQPQAVLIARPDGSTLGLADATGEMRISLEVADDGTTGLTLMDASATHRAGLMLDSDGSPLLGMFNTAGEAVRIVKP